MRLAKVAAPTTPAEATTPLTAVDSESGGGYLPLPQEALMAQHASAKKRNRQTLKRSARNRFQRSTVRSAVRAARRAIASGADDAAQAVQHAERLLRRAVSKGVFHSRTVSRTVSRLAASLARGS